ncbi:hypothetical protein CHGG_02267 [Chaetomium globosum CBS 148.51]|uniref:Uncharacterized protein n=1 Tax=Chaetomium globosum (strain ATCC 6205 / CBS 148.51 / DSM 1962 / NBRC 6347 / NRRL 1970) TaxID=306901 RepID=Q2HBY7_CHAGB|nr:uncharacterized protein CHGG_02267 [Chaetomium globosum CBS 148.51]EAQ90332.1 hypothetical protein CHGG_02267 [Chaetomium globosum CBS 148.51]
MTSLETTISQAAAKNTELLRVLSETDYAAPALEQQKQLITDLESEAAESDKRLSIMDIKRVREFSDHKEYRDSVLRRFLFKAAGQRAAFEARAQKEETEYFQALQALQSEQQVNTNIKSQLTAARQAATDLSAQVTRHTTAQQSLDQLYESIFSGPTPSLPGEDEHEQRATAAQRAYLDVRGRAEAEQMAVRLLAGAQRGMANASKSMEQALTASRHDMWGSGGSIADMMERNALQRAEGEMMAARMQVVQARGSKTSAAKVRQASTRLDVMAAEAGVRARDLDAELKRREEELREARVALQKIREKAFETYSVAPPAY